MRISPVSLASVTMLCVHALLIAACASSPQEVNVAIDWSGVTDLNSADQQNVREIATLLAPYRQISLAEGPRFFSGSRVLIATTSQGVNGVRVAWDEFRLCHRSDESCAKSSRWGVGNWRVLAELSLQERWRIFDGEWTADVELGGGVAYAEAEMLILAIRRNQMTKHPSLQQYFANMPSLEDRKISIRAINPVAREFSVIIYSGLTTYDLYMRINGTEVEFYEAVVAMATLDPPQPTRAMTPRLVTSHDP